jgi:GPH family glycoside/pentoside/hexuronide:cation symporter
MTTEEAFEEEPMKELNLVAYAITNFGVMLLLSFPATFLYYFFTDPIASGGLGFSVQEDSIRYILITIGLIIGIFCGPLMGYLSDRTRSRYGRRRIWMVIFAPLTGLFFVLLTIPFGREIFAASYNTATIYLIIVYIIVSVFSNAFYIPYQGLMADVTNPENRLKMSGVFNLWGALGTVLGLFLPIVLLSFIQSWVFVCVVYSIILIGTAFITIFTVKEPHNPAALDDVKRVPFKKILKDRKFLIFESAQFCWNLAFNLVLAALPAIADAVFGLGTATDFGFLALIMLPVMGVFFLLFMNKGDKWGKQRMMTFALLYLSIIIPLGTFLYYTRVLVAIPILLQGLLYMSLMAIGLAAIFVFPVSMLLDIVKKDQEASYMGVNGIFINTSGAVGTMIIFTVTALYAEDAFFIVAPILGLILAVAGAIFLFFPLYDKRDDGKPT